jgi:hypothetical protein
MSQDGGGYIGKVLECLFEAGQVVELRMPNTSQGTMSGYFDNLAELARCAGVLSGKVPGIFVTLNPVEPALLARAYNKIIPYAKHTTSDKEILRRRYLPMDFDPVRPSGISATDSEHLAAIERAREAKLWLEKDLGFPDVILADSGNGAHLLGAIDLPNNSESTLLIKQCLQALAVRFTDDRVAVDLTTYNAARIWKLYGTVAAKGESTPERPHRRAELFL